MNDVPLWRARVASLAVASCWAIISFAVGINAVVQSNHDKARVRSVAPPNSTVVINVNDVFQTGAVITAVSIIIFLTTCGYLALLTFRPTSFTRSKLISAQAYVLGFFTAWLFATLVPFTHFYRTRSARVEVMIGSFQVPDTVIQSIQQQFGLTPVYHELDYLRLVAILPWITFLFSLVATVILFVAASRTVPKYPLPPPVQAASPVMDEKVKRDSTD